MSCTGATKIAGVIGDPVEHSLSPALHNAGFAAAGLNWAYVAFLVPGGSGAAAVAAMKTLGIRGLSVTTPHKEAVAAAADVTTDTVRMLGAANCLALTESGKVEAHNTDGDGFVRALDEEAGFGVAGCRIVVLGAGGAARSVAEACDRAGAADLAIVNRSADRAAHAVAVSPRVGRLGTLSDLEAADLVVNATSLGMANNPGLPASTGFRPAQLVVDLIYNPIETRWLAAAAAAGATTMNGVSMLLHQAVLQFEIWTGVRAPIDEMRAAVIFPPPGPGAVR